jgi:hypothetical protein
VAGIPWVDVETPDPNDLAAHWGRLIDVPVGADARGHPALRFDLGAVRFVAAPAGSPERLATLHIVVHDPIAVLTRAADEGLTLERVGELDGFLLCGVRVVPQPA